MSDLGQDSGDFKNESFIEEEIEEESLEEEAECLRPEDFLKKNTSSFQCLAQVSISRSSLLLDPYYWFPELTNPKLDGCLGAEGKKRTNSFKRKLNFLFFFQNVLVCNSPNSTFKCVTLTFCGHMSRHP